MYLGKNLDNKIKKEILEIAKEQNIYTLELF